MKILKEGIGYETRCPKCGLIIGATDLDKNVSCWCGFNGLIVKSNWTSYKTVRITCSICGGNFVSINPATRKQSYKNMFCVQCGDVV